MIRSSFIVACTLLFLSGISHSQTNKNASLGQVLDPSGKIQTGVNGSFDATGYQIETGSDGDPRFILASNPVKTQSATYSSIGNTFGATGNNQSSPVCVLVNGDDIYVSGWITVAGTTVANGIVRWNGSNWVALGSGFNGNVLAMVFVETDLYAGGNFTRTGSLTVNSVAKWDGTEWSQLGNGVNGSISTIATDGANLFVGGSFTLAGSITANRVAKWNGSTWSALGTGMNSSVLTLHYSSGLLYAGGYFSTAGGTTAGRIAVWNGSLWTQVGTGVLGSSSYVSDIYLFRSRIYAGGYFTTTDGNAANYLMAWTGTEWSGLGTGINSLPYSLTSDGSYLYVGGTFLTAGGLSSPYAAKWDGTSWTSMGTGLDGQVDGMYYSGGKLYLVGTFSPKFAKWNGSFSYEPALNPDVITSGLSVTSVCVNGTDIYIGGYFSSVGGVAVNNIAKWNGTAWQALGSGVIGTANPVPVQALAHDGTFLYAGGYFTNAGGSSISYLAKWDGSSWSSAGGVLNGAVRDIELVDGRLFACGTFTTAGGTTVNYIAANTGGTWSALGTGLGSICYAISLDGENLYATGDFTSAGGSPANYVAMWNGTSWSALGTGLSNSGREIKFHNGKLYISGLFTAAGGIAANRAAFWNGSSWSGMATGLPAYAETIEAYGTDIYFGGSFTTAGNVNAAYIAKWNGSDWTSLGSGTDGVVRALAVQSSTGSMIYGGDFLVSNGNIFTQRIAKFTDSDNPLPVELTSFSGSFINGVVRLNWQTATEVDNYGFEIERKDASSGWQKIGFVEGHGISNSPKYYSLSDNSVTKGTAYSYRLIQIDGDGSFTYSHIINISTGVVSDYTLEQNFPNPFNPETVILFALPTPGEITLEVFNTQGEKVAVLTDGYHEAGVHSVRFKAEGLASGVYFYTLFSDKTQITKKLTILR